MAVGTQTEAPPNPLFKAIDQAQQLAVFCHLRDGAVKEVILYTLTFERHCKVGGEGDLRNPCTLTPGYTGRGMTVSDNHKILCIFCMHVKTTSSCWQKTTKKRLCANNTTTFVAAILWDTLQQQLDGFSKRMFFCVNKQASPEAQLSPAVHGVVK